MNIATLIQAVIFLGYVFYIYYTYGVLESISSSTYYLPKNRKQLFTFFCWGIAIPLYFQDMGMLGALAAAGLFFTGVTINHSDNELQIPIHRIASISAIALLYTSVILNGNYIIPLLFVMSCSAFVNSKNRIWWIEICAFVYLFIYFIIY